MRSQANINKVGHRKEKMKEYGEEYNLLPMDRVTDISANEINKLPGKTEVCRGQTIVLKRIFGTGDGKLGSMCAKF